MKYLAVTIILAVSLIGCVAAPPLPPDLCADQDASKSVLIKVAELRGIPLNEVYYGLIDVTAIGIATHSVEKQKIADFMNKLAKWYNENYPMSYTTLISYMTTQEEAEQLTGILSRRIAYFKSYLFISKYDDCLLRAGWSDAMNQLFLPKEQ